MELYGLGNNKKKKRKLWLIPVCIIAALLLAVFVLGIILNITNADRESIVAAVEENTELKQQIAELEEQVESLQAENAELNTQIEALPTPEPTIEPTDEPETSASPQPTPTSGGTPRG
ncbi:MAG: hypothetical protein LUD03_05710 [Firmicutes bacterium]|nr:hypothetical protein [Bacillota bacterium]